MKVTRDRIKARAQELRTEGYKVGTSLDMNAGATRSTAQAAFQPPDPAERNSGAEPGSSNLAR